jgi:hypothetical protein
MTGQGGNATFCFRAANVRKRTPLAVSPTHLTSTNTNHLPGENRGFVKLDKALGGSPHVPEHR